MSGKMAAIVACILGLAWTDPSLAEMAVTSDGMLLGRQEGDCGMNDILGTKADLDTNWTELLSCAKLTKAERELAESLYGRKVRKA